MSSKNTLSAREPKITSYDNGFKTQISTHNWPPQFAEAMIGILGKFLFLKVTHIPCSASNHYVAFADETEYDGLVYIAQKWRDEHRCDANKEIDYTQPMTLQQALDLAKD